MIALFSNFKFIISLKIPISSFNQYRILSTTIYRTKLQIKYISPRSLIIYEHAFSLNWFVPILLKQQGHKIIAIPHNLETLVISQISKISNRSSPEGFYDELTVLKTADLVLAISKEEEWLLNLFGIDTMYFPYLPSISESAYLSEIHQARTNRKTNNKYLILGNVGNPPTRLGMIELLSVLNKDETENLTFIIAGYLTEIIQRDIELPKRFIFQGSVDVSKLYELYKSVDAVIIHQKPSTGSLTKIPELLMAGIPVIVNNHAARNFFNIDGVTVYRSFNELNKIFSGIIAISKPVNFKEDTDIYSIQEIIEKFVDS